MKINESDFRTILSTTQDTVVAVFSATWCGPCKAFAPIFDEYVKAKHKGIVAVKLDVDECTQLCEDLNVSIVPTIMVLKNSQVAARHSGGLPTAKSIASFVANAGKQ